MIYNILLMSNCEYYTELIQKLTTQLNEVEKENSELKSKLKGCEGKFEMLYLFYSDFKSLIKNTVSSEKTISETLPAYDNLLSQYLSTKDVNILERLFEDYNISSSQILSDIRDKFPDNIDYFIKKYNCKNEYYIILKSMKNIAKLNKSGRFIEKGFMDLVSKYIANYNRGNKSFALKFLKHALIYFPFQFDDFLNNINQYRYDDLDPYIKKLKIKLYGENNILLPKNEKNIEISVKEKRTRIVFDYTNVPIQELVKHIESMKKNTQKQRAQMMLNNMKKFNRTENDCLLFKESINKLLINSKL